MATVTKEQARKFYETMATIRAFEESVKRDFLAGARPLHREGRGCQRDDG